MFKPFLFHLGDKKMNSCSQFNIMPAYAACGTELTIPIPSAPVSNSDMIAKILRMEL